MNGYKFFSIFIALVAVMLANGVVYAADRDIGSRFIRCLNTEVINSEKHVLSPEQRKDFADMLNKLYDSGILERAIDKFMKSADETSETENISLSEGDFVLERQDLDRPSDSQKTVITLSRTDVSYPQFEVEGSIYEITKGVVLKGYNQVCITRRNGFQWLTFIKPAVNPYDKDMIVIDDLEYSKLITKESSTLFLGEDHSADIRVVGYMYPVGDRPVYILSNVADCCDRFIKAMRDNDFEKAMSIYINEDESSFKKRAEQLRSIKDITYRTQKLNTSTDYFFVSIEVYGDGKDFREFNISRSEEGVIRIHDID